MAHQIRESTSATNEPQLRSIHDNVISLGDGLDSTSAKMSAAHSVQCFGKMKTATAVAHCRAGKGLIRVNGKPLSLVEPQILRFKVYEPVLILGVDKFGTYEHRL